MGRRRSRQSAGHRNAVVSRDHGTDFAGPQEVDCGRRQRTASSGADGRWGRDWSCHSPRRHYSTPANPERGRMISKYKLIPIGISIALLIFVWRTFFPVRETEFVLVTQFGQPLYTVTTPGLHMKWFWNSATFFDRRLRVYSPRPSEFLTRDKKNLVIENYVAWRIHDPKRFVETVGDPVAAEMRLHDIVWS